MKQLFERALWGSRLVVLVAVVFSVMLAVGAFYLATAEAVHALAYLARYADPVLTAGEREALGADAVTAIVEAVDWYLIAAILMVFAFGLYEFFIGKLQSAPRLLRVRNLHQLMGRIVALILLVTAIDFFRQALALGDESALEVLYFAVRALLISVALYLSSRRPSG